MRPRIHRGDLRAVLPTLAANSIEACVTDPPYGLGFMSQQWDGGIAFDPATWRAVYRVLAPGAWLVAFGGTRTSHRLVCAIEDAGFEIRDSLVWLYGSGFPKSRACLKPAHEPIVLARKPGKSGLLNIDACRIEHDGSGVWGNHGQHPERHIAEPGSHGATLGVGWRRPGSTRHTLGRWPANVILDPIAGAALDAQTGTLAASDGHVRRNHVETGASGIYGRFAPVHTTGAADTGGASRFFYCAKASRAERDRGCGTLPTGKQEEVYGTGLNTATKLDPKLHTQRGVDARPLRHNTHPTVKPVALLRWLIRLVTPPGGTVLDGFAGSGSTGVACRAEGRVPVLIEQDARYLPILRARVRKGAA